MSAAKLWPGSLGGRAVAILVAAVVLVHLASMVAYHDSALDAANTAQAIQLSDQMASAVQAISEREPAARDQAAHDLSSIGLSLRWSANTSLGTAGEMEGLPAAVAGRLSSLLPALGRNAVQVGYPDRQPPGDAHVLIGSIELPDASSVSFSVPQFGGSRLSLHAAVLSTSLMAGGVALVAILLVRTLVAPLRGLARAADGIGHNLDAPVVEKGPDEVRHVARAFNAMQSRIHGLIADRTQALAAVSHDLRTPLTRLRLRAGFLADTGVQAEMDADLDEMEAMIDATLAYLGGDTEPEAPRAVNLAAMLATLVDAAVDAGQPASFSGPRHLNAEMRGLAMKRAFSNVIDNALAYGGAARVTLQSLGGEIRVIVDDDGPGIPEVEFTRVFEAFTRLEASRNRHTGGVGLGLAIARQAVEREGGTVSLSNRAEGGLRVELILPRRSSGQASGPQLGRGRFSLFVTQPSSWRHEAHVEHLASGRPTSTAT